MLSDFSPPTLCTACQSIFADYSIDSLKYWFKGGIFHYNSDYDSWRRHHPPEDSYREAVTQGCWICTKIVDHQKKENKSEEQLFNPNSYDIIRTEKNNFKLMFDGHKPSFLIENIESWTPCFELACSSKSELWTGNDHAITLAQHWLEKCMKEHRCCERTLDPEWYPTRLLDVADEPIKLIITKDEPVIAGPYATLSHCWGTQEFPVLSTNSLSDFLAGTPSEKLPRSFRETITTIRALGIRYLWIDSYCILQGVDKAAQDDWIQEAGQMQEVYSNSCLNIGSAHASSPYGGLFHHRKLHNEDSMFITWRPMGTSVVSRYVMAKDNIVDELHHRVIRKASKVLSESTLLNRGWVTQEMILSPRMLSFTDKKILWYCGEMAICEDFPGQGPCSVQEAAKLLPFWSLPNSTQIPPEKSYKESRTRSDLGHRKTIDLKDEWFHILNTYTRAKLSYPDKDIFKAIEGIGMRISRLARNIYAHGILGGTLPYALVWSSEAKVTSRGSQHRAPTWHWAYQEHHPDGIYHTRYHGCKHIPLAYPFLSDDCQQLAPEGSPKDFWPYIVCIGRLLMLQLGGCGELYGFKNYYFVYYPDPTHEITFRIFVKEGTGELDLSPRTQYAFLPLTRDNEYSEDYIKGIILRQTGNGLYKRVGSSSEADPNSQIQKRIAKTKPQILVIE